MVLVEVDVGEGSFVVRIPARGWSRSWRDTASLRGGTTIVGVGEMHDDREAAPAQPTSGSVITRPALATHGFDPAVAAAIIEYTTLQGARDAGLGWRSALLGVCLRLRHPGWPEIPTTDRRRFLELCGFSRIEVNGTVVVRPRVDVPIIGPLVGRRWISPDAE